MYDWGEMEGRGRIQRSIIKVGTAETEGLFIECLGTSESFEITRVGVADHAWSWGAFVGGVG